jgi:hypothetical protein
VIREVLNIVMTSIARYQSKFTRIEENRNFPETVDGKTQALQKFHGLSSVAIGAMAELLEKAENSNKLISN